MAWLEMKDFGVVYLIRNTVNGKCYVGQTVRPLALRWHDHVSKSMRGSKLPLCNAIRKYGRDAFECSVLVSAVDRASLDAEEKLYIAAYKSNDQAFGYNLAAGGNSNHGWVMSEETKLHISQAKRGKPGLNGRTVSSEHRRKLSEALKGRVFSAEALRKMSESHRKKRSPLSAETRRKISLSLTGHPPFQPGLRYV